MAKKQERKIYYPSDEDLSNARICWQNDKAFGMRRVDESNDLYYIERYNISNYRFRELLRADLTIPLSYINRLKLNEYEAWVKVFELYKLQAMIINKKKEGESKEVVSGIIAPLESYPKARTKTNEKPLGSTKQLQGPSNKQIDLLDMIAEVKQENQDLT